MSVAAGVMQLPQVSETRLLFSKLSMQPCKSRASRNFVDNLRMALHPFAAQLSNMNY